MGRDKGGREKGEKGEGEKDPPVPPSCTHMPTNGTVVLYTYYTSFSMHARC